MTDTNTGKKLLKFVSLTILFLIIIFYGIWKGRDLIFGIHLTINGIQNNETVTQSVLELSGNAYHAVSITINGRVVSVEENGAWHDTIALLKGYNIIKITAKDKFGRIITKEFTVNYKEPPGITPPTTDIPRGKTSSSSATSTN
jgi:hypothetical protein